MPVLATPICTAEVRPFFDAEEQDFAQGIEGEWIDRSASEIALWQNSFTFALAGDDDGEEEAEIARVSFKRVAKARIHIRGIRAMKPRKIDFDEGGE
ncbi:hypothetical protein [Rubinisphaera margarita]|uniref:hypothetical protein n=1 Tax=Rubinisphaera margarita TaxID=2909586 RepID=UPI001EE95C9F|nr:hypothetical protein [Rubinisphaera margarita]MCG6157108.1 hypothetical protein [Rubinisphaera margarita]